MKNISFLISVHKPAVLDFFEHFSKAIFEALFLFTETKSGK